MSSLFWKISIPLLVNIQVIKAESTVQHVASIVDPSLADQTTDLQSLDLLPDTTVCGNSGRLDQFPWMALIEYKRSNNGTRRFLCGGSLINKRYILTTALCVKGAIDANLTMSSVRLGEFDLETDPDCFKTVKGVECAPSPLDVEIEEQIVHEDYNNDRNKQHDIALLRLKEEIKFTETVRPLCLATTSKERSETHVGERLTVVGWGRTETKSSSRVKRKVKIPVQDKEVCRSQYKKHNLDLGDGQFCAGGELGRDSCRGDTGNALLAPNINKEAKGYLYAAGIVSLGPTPCGLEDWPSVYTNVSAYMSWILDKLRP